MAGRGAARSVAASAPPDPGGTSVTTAVTRPRHSPGADEAAARARPSSAATSSAATATATTAVDALAGVSLSVAARRARRRDGARPAPASPPSCTSSPASTGPPPAAPGSPTHEITAMGDTALTKLRRRHIGFVFQFFNLLPTLTAEENITLPARIAGRRPERAWLDEVIASVGLDDAPRPPAGPALRRPAAARRHRPRDPRPADGHVRRRAHRQPRLPLRRRDPRAAARARPSDYGQTTVMVTHDATRGDHRRPHRVPRGRRASSAPRAPPPRPRSWTRWRR